MSFQTYLSQQKSAKQMDCKMSFFPLITPPAVFSAHLADIVCCIFENTRECISHRLDIFSYSLWVLHATIDPTGLHERQLQKRKVLIYLACLKGVPKDYTCCVYFYLCKKRNCFCIETFSSAIVKALGKHWGALMCHGFTRSVSDIRLCQKIPLFSSDRLME